MTKDASLTIRLPADLKAKLQEAADREDRKLSALAERILREWADKQKRR